MVKLSRRAWNNVLIFSMLILIFIFNSTSNFLNGGDDNKHPISLIPNSAIIASFDFDSIKVERIGQGWRALGITVKEQQLVKLNQAWSSAQIATDVTDISISQANDSKIVIIHLLGIQQPLKFEIFSVAGQTLVLNQQRLMLLIDTPYKSLFLTDNNDA